jgi:hypothetical protein
MLRNARDAKAKDIYIATTKEGNQRSLVVIDDGDGIPADLQKLIFEPRVTSKLETMLEDDWGVHGRGMALFSIKSNVTSASVVSSGVGLGSSIAVQVDTDLLPEKTDQSTFPEVSKDEEGNLRATKGPHNIMRTALEFALSHKKATNVFLGAPSAIAMTLIERGSKSLSNDDLLFCKDVSDLPISQRLAASSDAMDLMLNCSKICLDISERTAHRILSGQIASLPALYDMAKGERVKQATPDLIKDNRGLRLAKEDIEAFSREMERAFELLAERYYLSLTDVPKITAKGDAITVRFQIEKD